MQEEREKRLRRILQAGQWTEEDLAWFMEAWDRDEEGWMKRVLREAFDATKSTSSTEVDSDAEALLGQLHERMGSGSARGRQSIFVRIAVAASLILALFGTTYLWLSVRKTTVKEPDSGLQMVSADIGPGSDRAILILPDGRILHLDGMREGTLDVGDEGLKVRLQDEGIRYAASEEHPKSTDPTLQHAIQTPRGGQYTITLSDGTRVWLNASSTIRFPTVFTGGERRVAIIGEAYLEVAHDEARPGWMWMAGGLSGFSVPAST
jgi:hypothetical protein